MKVIDNFLPAEYFKAIQTYIMDVRNPWLFAPGVAYVKKDDNGIYNNSLTDFYFIHDVYHNLQIHDQRLYQMMGAMLNEYLKAICLIRSRCIMYTNVGTMLHHDPHTDMPYTHKALILYINTCDGGTEFPDGTKVESIENRALIFDGSKHHNSTTTTDQKRRVILSCNYIDGEIIENKGMYGQETFPPPVEERIDAATQW